MTALMLARPRRVSSRVAYAATAALVSAVVVGAVVTAVRSGDDAAPTTTPPEALAAERAALERFEADLDPILDAGGFLVANGMRPGVADIAEGTHGDATLVTMAEGWVAGTRDLRSRFAALDVPSFLDRYGRTFAASLDAYVAVAEKLRAAASATGEERQRLVAEVPPLGSRADELFDRAEELLERQRARLGLSPDAPG